MSKQTSPALWRRESVDEGGGASREALAVPILAASIEGDDIEYRLSQIEGSLERIDVLEVGNRRE